MKNIKNSDLCFLDFYKIIEEPGQKLAKEKLNIYVNKSTHLPL